MTDENQIAAFKERRIRRVLSSTQEMLQEIAQEALGAALERSPATAYNSWAKLHREAHFRAKAPVDEIEAVLNDGSEADWRDDPGPPEEETYNGWTRAQWIEHARRFCSYETPKAVAESLGNRAFDTRSCLIHASWLIGLEVAGECDICGSKTLRHREKRHELCRLRKKKGMPTPPIPPAACTCARCKQ